MTGSEKQIEWANQIKSIYDAALADLNAQPALPTQTDAQRALFAKLNAISQVEDAAWWIDNRAYLSPKNWMDLARGTAVNLHRGDFALPAGE
jgi:hypothetical protein